MYFSTENQLMKQVRAIIMKLFPVLDEGERQYIAQKMTPLNPLLKRYLSLLLSERDSRRLAQKERQWFKRRKLKPHTIYRLRREAMDFTFSVLQEYYLQTDETRRLARALMMAYLSPRIPEIAAILEDCYLPPPQAISFWADKFPWYWAEYAFLNMFSGSADERTVDLALTGLIGASTAAELFYTQMAAQVHQAIMAEPGIPITSRDLLPLNSSLDAIEQFFTRYGTQPFLAGLKIISLYFFLRVLNLSWVHYHRTIVEHLVGAIDLLLKKELYRLAAILLSDALFMTFPHLNRSSYHLVGQLSTYIQHVWRGMKARTHHQPEFILGYFATFAATWLYHYGRVEEIKPLEPYLEGKTESLWKFPLTFFKLFQAGRLGQIQAQWERLATHQPTNKILRLATYLAELISSIERGEQERVKDVTVAFYQWARRHHVADALARLVRRLAAVEEVQSSPLFWQGFHTDLGEVYAREPLVAHVEFLLPVSVYVYHKAYPALTPEQVLRQYGKRLSHRAGPISAEDEIPSLLGKMLNFWKQAMALLAA